MYTSFIFALLLAISSNTSIPKVEAAELSREELVAMAMANASAYHLNIDHFVKTIECESNFNIDAVGDNGTSFGIVQIHLSAHKEITQEQALDPIFALKFMAISWSEGNSDWWSCWSNLYSKKTTP